MMKELLIFEVDRRAIVITLNSFTTALIIGTISREKYGHGRSTLEWGEHLIFEWRCPVSPSTVGLAGHGHARRAAHLGAGVGACPARFILFVAPE
jgi:hypothetical protein